MTQLILKGSEKKLSLMKSLAGEMGLTCEVVKKKKKSLTRKQAKLAAGLKEALKEVELAEQGKIKLTSWEEFKKELATSK